MRSLLGKSFAVFALALAAGCTQQPFTVDVSLRVVSISPSGGSVGFGRRDAAGAPTPLTITFSEALDEASVSADTVSLTTAEGTAIPAAVAYSAEGSLVTVTPAKSLAYSTLYKLTLTTGIKRKRDGSPLSVQVTSTFKTVDPQPLTLLSATPGGGTAEVDRRATLKLQFSEPVKCDSLKAGVKITEAFDLHPRTKKADAEVKGTWVCKEPSGDLALEGGLNCAAKDASLCTVTFKPDDATFAFEWSSHVKIELTGRGADKTVADPAAVKSFRATKDGGYLEQSLSLPFHVQSPPAFVLTAVSPAAGATGVDRKPALQLTFSEPPRCETLLASAVVKLEEIQDAHPRLGGNTLPVAGKWTVGGKAVAVAADCPIPPPLEVLYACKAGATDDPCVAVFTPDASLEWSSALKISLKGGAYAPDAAPGAGENFLSSTRVTTHGGTLSTDVTFDFRVKDPPALAVLGALPGAVSGDLKVAPATLLRDGSLLVKFSEPVNCATLNDKTVTVTEDADGPGAAVAAAVPVALVECDGKPTAKTDTLTITRKAGFYGYSSVVTLTLAGGPFNENKPAAFPSDAAESAIATTRGGQLAANTTFTFIAQDPPALLVLTSTPGAGAVNAPLNTPIKVTFNQPVKVASFTTPGALAITRVNVFDRSARARADLGAGALPGCTLSCVDANADGLSDLDDAANPAAGSTCTCDVKNAAGTGAFGFDFSSLVTATLAPSATSALTTWRSGALPAAVGFTFRTVNPSPLLVSWTSPSDHDVNIPSTEFCDGSGNCTAAPIAGASEVSSGVMIHFDRDVDCTSVIGTTKAGPNTLIVEDSNARDSAGNLIVPTPVIEGAAACAVDSSGKLDASTVLFRPNVAMRAGAHVRVTVKRAAIATDATTTSNTGVRSKDWTDASANSSGTLVGTNFGFGFDVALPPLSVVDSFPRPTDPTTGQPQAPPNTKVVLVFNQNVACDAANNQLATQFKIVGDPASGASANPTVTFSCANYDPVTFTAVYTVTDPLAAAKGTAFVPGGKYAVTLKSGATGPVGVNGQSFLRADFTLAFTVANNTLRGYELPPVSSTGIHPDQVICEIFTGVLSNASPDPIIKVQFTDATGRLVNVQGDAQFWNFPDKNNPQTGAPTTSPKTIQGNAVCLVPKLASYDCLPTAQRLPYSHDFTVTVSGASSGGETQASAFTWTFRTIDPPQIKRATYINDVLTGPTAESLLPTAGVIPSDVPVNSQFVIDFTGPLEKTTLTGAAVTLTNTATSKSYALCPAAPPAVAVECLTVAYSNLLNGDATRPQTATFTVQSFSSAATTPLVLDFAAPYTLTLRGGAQGVAIVAAGTPSSTTRLLDTLPVNVSYSFLTSPETFAIINPTCTGGGTTGVCSLFPDEEIPVLFTRPIRLSTANTNNIFGRDTLQNANGKMTGIVALNAGDDDSAVLITSPTFTKGGLASVVVTIDLQDSRGNPLRKGVTADATDPNAAVKSTYATTGNTPSLASEGPAAIGCLSVAPNNIGSCVAVPVNGDQSFTVTFAAASSEANRFLPAPFNGDALKLVATGGAGGCLASGTRLPLLNRYRPAANGGTGDSLLLTTSTRFKAGCTYSLTLDQTRFANVFNLTAAGALPVVVTLTGETVAPTLVDVRAANAAGVVSLAAGATDVAGDSALVVTYSENMDAASFASQVTLKDNKGNPNVPLTVTAGPNAANTCTSCVVTVVPRAALAGKPGIMQNGSQYTLVISNNVSDLAGNKVAANSSTPFTVESVKPTVAAPVLLTRDPVTGQRSVTLTFSERIDPATLVADLFNSDGSVKTAGTVRLTTSTGAAVAGCIALDPTGKTVILTTTDGTVAAGSYNVVVTVTGPAGVASTGVTDQAGNPLAGASTQAVTFP